MRNTTKIKKLRCKYNNFFSSRRKGKEMAGWWGFRGLLSCDRLKKRDVGGGNGVTEACS